MTGYLPDPLTVTTVLHTTLRRWCGAPVINSYSHPQQGIPTWNCLFNHTVEKGKFGKTEEVWRLRLQLKDKSWGPTPAHTVPYCNTTCQIKERCYHREEHNNSCGKVPLMDSQRENDPFSHPSLPESSSRCTARRRANMGEDSRLQQKRDPEWSGRSQQEEVRETAMDAA